MDNYTWLMGNVNNYWQAMHDSLGGLTNIYEKKMEFERFWNGIECTINDIILSKFTRYSPWHWGNGSFDYILNILALM